MQEKTKNISFKKILPWIIIALIALGLALLPLLTAEEDNSEAKATIKNETAAIRDIDTVLIGGGQIESSGVFDLEIPENIKIKEFLVSNGDTVKEGDPIAIVDKVSTMTAITGIQETLDELADEIQDADSSSTTTYITSTPGGTVKKIYAQKGDDVEDVMLNYGCLAIISLDDTMGVSITADTDLMPGDKVNVTIGDDTVTGRVKTNANGTLTLTVDDDSYEIGDIASVFDKDDNLLGSGMLYVYNPWNVTGSTGTVSYVYIHEGSTVYSGQTIFTVKESGKNSDYQKAVDKHQTYEELLKEVFNIYSKGYVEAPCDGIVSGIDTTGDYMLSYNPESGLADGSGYKVVLLVNERPTATINGTFVTDGTVNTYYQCGPFTATLSGGSEALTGTWSVSGLPNGLTYSTTETSLSISGTPTVSGSATVTISFSETSESKSSEELAFGSATYTLTIADEPLPAYYVYAAKITSAENGRIVGSCAKNPITIYDLKDLSSYTASESACTTPFDVYIPTTEKLSAGDMVWIIIDESGNKSLQKANGGGGGGGGGGGTPTGGGGSMSGMTGTTGTTEEDDGLYSLEKVVIGTVTSQEEMTVSISIDELDITKVYVGQTAMITMDSFAEEPVEAVVTNISNSGENSGGNSKFTVELKLNKSSEMLPGMNATATITLDKASNVLSVPSAAVYTLNGKKVVYTSYNEKDEILEDPVEVEIGVADADYVQILSGLSENDTVYYEIFETIGSIGPSNSL